MPVEQQISGESMYVLDIWSGEMILNKFMHTSHRETVVLEGHCEAWDMILLQCSVYEKGLGCIDKAMQVSGMDQGQSVLTCKYQSH